MHDLKKESAVFNEKTLTLEIDVIKRSWVDRLLKRAKARAFIVRQPPIGVLEEVGTLVAKLGAYKSPEKGAFMPMVFERLKTDATTMIDVMACFLECKAYPSKGIKKFIRENVMPEDIAGLIANLFEFADIPAFLNTTILMKGMGLKKTEGIIASENADSNKTSGAPSETLSATSTSLFTKQET